jgi:hypothetical protein
MDVVIQYVKNTVELLQTAVKVEVTAPGPQGGRGEPGPQGTVTPEVTALRDEAVLAAADAAASAVEAGLSAGLAEQAVIDAANASRLTIGTVETLPPDGTSEATITGVAGSQALNLKLVTGLQGEPGEDGIDGVDGLSAYQIAVINGFIGTEVEWLASLVGADGTDGTNGTDGSDGLSAYQIAVINGFVGTEAEWLDSLQGTDGTNGTDGVGVVAGGTTGQVLTKVSGTDYDTTWTTPGTGGGAVDSVNGQTGTVVLTKEDIGLSAVNNTSDANKPVSTATQMALDLKANLASPTFTGTVGGISKAMVGLSNVDNTADSAKPVSTATQTALDLKAPLTHVGTGGTQHATATTSVAGFMSAADKTKMDGLATVAASGAYADLSGKPTLGTAAATAASDYATASQGAKADSALQPAAIGVSVQAYAAGTVVDSSYVHTDNNYTTTEKTKLSGIQAGAEVNVNADWAAASGDAQILNKPILGTAAATAITDYATAAQGTKADSALQPAAIGVSVQAYDVDLTSWAAIPPSSKQDTLVSGTNIKTINGSTILGSGDLTVSGGGATAYTASVSTASWTGTGPYTKTVSITGLTSSSKVILDLDMSSAAFSDVTNIQAAYALLYRAVPGTDSLTLYATSSPAIAFNINATVV